MYLTEILFINSIFLITYIIIYAFYFRRKFKNNISALNTKGAKLRYFLSFLNLTFSIIIGGIFIYLFVLPAKVSSSSLKFNETWSDYHKPYEIVFDRPVSKKSFNASFSVPLKGTWTFEKSNKIDIFKRKLVFHPEESLLPDQKIMVSANYKTLLNLTSKTVMNSFMSGINKPEIKFINAIDDNQNVNPEQFVALKIENVDPESFKLYMESTPPIDLSQINDKHDLSNVNIIHEKPFKNGQQYIIKIYTVPVAYNLKTKKVIGEGTKSEAKEVKFQVAPSPVIKEILPKGEDVLSSEKISISFDHEMDKPTVEKGIKIEPSIQTAYEWNAEGDRLTLKPEKNLEKETQYKVSISKNIKSKYGAKLVQDENEKIIVNDKVFAVASQNPSSEANVNFDTGIEHVFKTIGSVGVASTFPVSGTENVKVDSKISITFNQDVDKISAESKISFSPTLPGAFSWDKNILTYSPTKPLKNAQNYNVSVGAGIKSIEGLDLKSNYTFSFTTESKTVLLKTPIINQPAVFACNVTAAAIVLQYKGINVGPWDVYNSIPKQTTADISNGWWGNPNLGFVGNINGGTSGYGVYWGPIANYINSKKPGSAQVKQGWNVSELLTEIDNGNPSILWWQNGVTNPEKLSWKSYDAAGNQVTITGVRGMHSEVVVGYIGSPDNPSQIIISDPWATRWGYNYRYISIDRFNSLWSYFNNTAVVVR